MNSSNSLRCLWSSSIMSDTHSIFHEYFSSSLNIEINTISFCSTKEKLHKDMENWLILTIKIGIYRNYCSFKFKWLKTLIYFTEWLFEITVKFYFQIWINKASYIYPKRNLGFQFLGVWVVQAHHLPISKKLILKLKF